MASNCGRDAGDAHRKCIKTRTDNIRRCTEERDEGWNECTQTRKDRVRECCDWIPCSFACEIFWYVVNVMCVAWEWVSNVVCVTWEWTKQVVCTAWLVLTVVACTVIDSVVSAVGGLVTLLETELGWALSVVGFVVALIKALPGIGRLLGWLLESAFTIVNAILSAPDAFLAFLGIMPEKKLRLGVIVLQDAQGRPVAEDGLIARAVDCAIHTFREEVNVRVVPIAYASYRSAYSEDQRNSPRFIFRARRRVHRAQLDGRQGGLLPGAADRLGDGEVHERRHDAHQRAAHAGSQSWRSRISPTSSGTRAACRTTTTRTAS